MSKQTLFTIGFLVAFAAVGGYFIYKIPSPSVNMNGEPLTSPEPTANTMNDKLEVVDEKVGTGTEAVGGKKVTVNYTGTLADGTTFDSNTDPKFNHLEPFSFTLGAGDVIAGWDQGVAGMKVGGKRKLTIPPSLGYGSNDLGVIPPNSTLIFEVELLKVE